MKVTFEIPDFVPPERIIYIIAGNHELIGVVEPHTRKVKIKTVQCVRCGECCRRAKCDDLIFKNGFWSCNRDKDFPFICVVSRPKFKECAVKWAAHTTQL